MKSIKKNKLTELLYSENFEIEGGIFKEGSFLDSFFSAVSEGYRDFKAFLRGN